MVPKMGLNIKTGLVWGSETVRKKARQDGGGRAPGVRKRRQILSNRLRRRLGHPMGRVRH